MDYTAKDFDLIAKFEKYIKAFPKADVPNYWECGSWEAVEEALDTAIETNTPWVSTTPKDVFL